MVLILNGRVSLTQVSGKPQHCIDRQVEAVAIFEKSDVSLEFGKQIFISD